MFTKTFQPLFYSKIGNGPANKICNQDQPEEFPGKQRVHIRYCSPVHPSDTDLPGFTLDHKGGQSDESETGNQNGEDGEDDG